MLEVYRDCVETWECDVMGHMNVRFYISRFSDGLSGLATELGAGRTEERRSGRGLVEISHHVRFHRELRPGTAVVILGGVLRASRYGLDVYLELRNAARGEQQGTEADEGLGATCVVEARFVGLATRERAPLGEDVLARARERTVELPRHGAPRGLELDPWRPNPTLQQAEEAGLYQIYRGVVHPVDCDAHGYLTAASLMARLSAGVPNLFLALRGEDRSAAVSESRGGAAVEYRIAYRTMPRIGDRLAVRSGLRRVGAKTLNLVHWVFDVETGKAVATAEAVSVGLDLETRRVRTLSEEERGRLEDLAHSELSV